MIDKIFDGAFLYRLALAMEEVEHERAQHDGSEPLDALADEAIFIAYEESGGDAAAARKRLTTAREGCDQAFGRILQFISDQYGNGPIEHAGDEILKALTRDGFEATENWGEHVEANAITEARESPFRDLLKSHYRIQETARALHDELLWPLAKRISPEH
jgi:hypothetical protein